MTPPDPQDAGSVAIVGMSGRFPGAGTVREFWENLRQGVESISRFSPEELVSSGVGAEILDEPSYVNAAGVLENVERFDAEFFGFTPRTAEITDPQQRLFLECAWESLEDAGHDPQRFGGRIGVYAGASTSHYYLLHLHPNRSLLDSVGAYQALLSTEKDFLTTLVSYKLNLRGPSINIQTACSTSLVAVHYACQDLLSFHCDMALAGGSSVRVPHRVGYLYREGGIASPDGHCRAFDARAAGTVSGSGVGVVVLKRLADALADGDHVYAVIRGTAVNNDGSGKPGFTAPSIAGQAEVIAEAQALAGVEPRTVTYVETHGTGTPLGDPIEVAALSEAFRAGTHEKGFCALGSVKTNVGHLDAAAGVAGLIKTALALEAGELPPSLHFERPNPKLDLDGSPFFVNRALSEWRVEGMPRRAGVSSFGIGGTNAHAVVEEAPPRRPSGPSRPWQLLPVSARTAPALDAAAERLAGYLGDRPSAPLADVAYTLQVGRRAFEHRRAVVCRSAADAVEALLRRGPDTGAARAAERSVVFLFPGQGAQRIDMALDLYRAEPTFRAHLDRCCELASGALGFDLREALYPGPEPDPEQAARIHQTSLAQPALFAVEYALARLWMEWGVSPQAMMGHSIGEYVAATLAGVFTLEDAVALVVARGRLMQRLPGGAMLAVPLSERELRPLLGDDLSLAAVNAPDRCTVSGTEAAVRRLEAKLAADGVNARRVVTSHAFHSAMMDPAVEELAERLREIPLRPPRIPFVSNVSGDWISPEEATDPRYWARQLREPVRFADGIELLRGSEGALFLEVGPGRTLSAFARRGRGGGGDAVVLSSIPRPREAGSEQESLLGTLGALWQAGVPVDWSGLNRHAARNRVPLPTYPFERRRHWVDRQDGSAAVRGSGPLPPEGRVPGEPRRDPAPVEPPAQRSTDLEGDVEEGVAELWCALLGVDGVSRSDNFFDLGADSLLAVQLVSRLQRLYPVDLDARTVFEAPTLAALSALIESRLVELVEQMPEDEARLLLEGE